MMSDGTRLVVVNPTTLLVPDTSSTNNVSCVVADYQLGDQFGKLTYADFALGKDHAIVLFEEGNSACILSLARAQRDDLVNVKFSSSRSIVRSPSGHSLLVIQRVKGHDQVALLGTNDGNVVVQSSFDVATSDAQGAMFAPNQDPVFAVWDSAAYGTAVYFYSAMGHPLKQLDISGFSSSSAIEGLGLSTLRWAKNGEDTVLAAADGNKQVLFRHQHNRTMNAHNSGILHHPPTIDGSKSIVWQQMEDNEFSLQKGALDAVLVPDAGGNTSILELNSDQTFVATVPVDHPNSVWLWQPEHPDPHSVIIFREPVRQLLWHPRHAHVLVMTTVNKAPRVFAWYLETKPPAVCDVLLPNTASSKFEVAWLGVDSEGRRALVVTSARAFNVGYLSEDSGKVRFQSLLRDDVFGLDMNDDMTELSTPSKPGRRRVDASDGGAW